MTEEIRKHSEQRCSAVPVLSSWIPLPFFKGKMKPTDADTRILGKMATPQVTRRLFPGLALPISRASVPRPIPTEYFTDIPIQRSTAIARKGILTSV